MSGTCLYFIVHIVLIKQFSDQEVIVNHVSEYALERPVGTYLSVDSKKDILWTVNSKKDIFQCSFKSCNALNLLHIIIGVIYIVNTHGNEVVVHYFVAAYTSN
jgi:hypothetical protein